MNDDIAKLFDAVILKRAHPPVTIERSLGVCIIRDGVGDVLGESKTGNEGTPFLAAAKRAIECIWDGARVMISD
jgi:hypothetical protein